MTRLLSTSKIARVLDKSERWVRTNLLQTGRMKYCKQGRQFYVPEDEVERYIGGLLHRRVPRKQVEREVAEARAFFGYGSDRGE